MQSFPTSLETIPHKYSPWLDDRSNHDYRQSCWIRTNTWTSTQRKGVCTLSCPKWHSLSRSEPFYQFHENGTTSIQGLYSCQRCYHRLIASETDPEPKRHALSEQIHRNYKTSSTLGHPREWYNQGATGGQMRVYMSKSQYNLCVFTGLPMPNQEEVQTTFQCPSVMSCQACYATRVNRKPPEKLLSCQLTNEDWKDGRAWFEYAFPYGLQTEVHFPALYAHLEGMKQAISKEPDTQPFPSYGSTQHWWNGA